MLLSQTDTILTRDVLQALPKIDLHRHLEGSLRLDTLFEIVQTHRMRVSAKTLEELRPQVQITNDPPTSDAFLSKFHVLRHFYRSPEIIQRVVYEAVADAAKDGIDYLELRFSPQALSRVRGFPLPDVTDWVIEAVNRASRDYAIQVGLIVTLVRHDPVAQARHVLKVAVDHKDKGIVGLDLAGDEVRFPPDPFMGLFREAKQEGLGITIHAGEWASAFGVEQAITKLGADRIGHGIRTMENSQVLRLVLERQPAFEVCLKSNLQTGVVHRMVQHPLVDMLDVGLLATLNTDDPTISNCTLTDEYEAAVSTLDIDYTGLRKMILNAANAAFLPPAKRQKLVAHFTAVLPPDAPPHPSAKKIPILSTPA